MTERKPLRLDDGTECTFSPMGNLRVSNGYQQVEIQRADIEEFETWLSTNRPEVPHRGVYFTDAKGDRREVCECGTVSGLHEFGAHVDCEYHNHHCEMCHELGICTSHAEQDALADRLLDKG